MKHFVFVVAFIFTSALVAQPPETNYDENCVPKYTLPSLLTCNDGKVVNSTHRWEKRRRPELLTLFAENVFGETRSNSGLTTKFTITEQNNAFDGRAIRRQIELVVSKKEKKRTIRILLYLPAKRMGEKSPVFVGLNFQGNQTICHDPEVIPSESWCRADSEFNVTDNTKQYPRGTKADRWCVDKLIDAGYGVATACYNDIYPDSQEQVEASILPLFSRPNENPSPSAWQAIGAWAWGLSRIMDYLETDKEVNTAKVALIGHSRLGKAALWAGVQDQRFGMVISNNSGCGGAALSKRRFGETVERITAVFPHWFCKKFTHWGNHISEMPFDQHQLLALIAPRPLYVASAEDDRWADPKGEYLAAHYASPVYTLYGLKGMENTQPPLVNQPIMNHIGYHIRSGKHNITPYDWDQFIIFANKHFK